VAGRQAKRQGRHARQAPQTQGERQQQQQLLVHPRPQQMYEQQWLLLVLQTGFNKPTPIIEVCHMSHAC
jgi:hypothetical protein